MTSTGTRSLQNGNAEDKLDQDFLLFLSHAKWCLMELPEKFRERAGAWIKCLISRNPRTISEKKIRNMHLSSLLLHMSFGHLRGVYAEKPPNLDEPLPLTAAVFQDTAEQTAADTADSERDTVQPPEWVQKLIEGCEQAPDDIKKAEISHTSKDGRIYLATKALPDHPGAYGFLAMSMEKKDGLGDGIDNRGPTIDETTGGEELEREQKVHTGELRNRLQRDKCATQKMAAELLAWRRPPDARESVDRIYQNLLALVERAMKGEKSDRVEVLLQQMEEDMKTDSTYDLLWELPTPAKREELLKRLLDIIVLKRGQLTRREKFLRRMEEIVPPLCKDFVPEQSIFNLSPNLSAIEPLTLVENQTVSRTHSAKAKNVDGLIAHAIEDYKAESNLEFDQKLASLREELQLDLSSARTKHQRATLSYETALKALNQVWEELEKISDNPRRLNILVDQLEMLQNQNMSYSKFIAEELKNLCGTIRQVRDIRTFHQRELGDLKSELQLKKHYLSDMVQFYEGILGQSVKRSHNFGPEEECE